MRRPSYTELRRARLARRVSALETFEARSLVSESLGVFTAVLAAGALPRLAEARPAEVAPRPATVAGSTGGETAPDDSGGDRTTRARAIGDGMAADPSAGWGPADSVALASATPIADVEVAGPAGASAASAGVKDSALAGMTPQPGAAPGAVAASAGLDTTDAAAMAPGGGDGAASPPVPPDDGRAARHVIPADLEDGMGDGPGGPMAFASVPSSGSFDAFPLYTLDYNHGAVLFPDAPQVAIPGEAVDLRAQVRLPSGASSVSYSWNTSGLTHATSISGASTQRLQFTWASSPTFPSGVDFLTDTVTLTATAGGQSEVQTYTFTIPRVRANTAASAPSWSGTLAPGLVRPDAPAFDAHHVDVVAASGAVTTAIALPSYGPNLAPAVFRYSSLAADPRPIVDARYALPATVPTTITAALTFDGTSAGSTTYGTSDLVTGDIVRAALQADATGLATGRYAYSVDVTAGATTTTFTGTTSVVNAASSAFGAGWSLDGLHRLVAVAGSGVLLDVGAGNALWFAGTGSTFTSPPGDFSTLVKNAGGDYTRTLPDGATESYSSAGRLTAVADRNGLALGYAYDGSGRLSTITDPYGDVTTLAYDSTSSLLRTVTDPAGRVTTMTHTGTRLTGVALPGGATSWAYGYDSAGRLTTVTDPNAKVTTVAYDAAKRAASTSRPDGTSDAFVAHQTRGFAAAGSGTVAAVLLAEARATYTDPAGKSSDLRTDWYGLGLPVTAVDPLSYVATSNRDADGLVRSTVDPIGRVGQAAYDSKGNPTTVVHADLATETFAYNGFSQVTVATDPLGKATTSTYDSEGNRTVVQDPLQHRTTFTYTANGRVATAKDANGRTTSFAYDSRDRLTTVVAPGGDTVRYGYDAYGNRNKVTDARSKVTTTTHDALNRPTATIDPLSYATSYGHDAYGNRRTVTDPNGKVTTTAYDAMNRPSTVTDPNGGVVTYTYDNAGRLRSLTDPVGNRTTYTYDDAGRKTVELDPRGKATTFAYDAADQVTERIDRNGRSTTYGYDRRGRIVGERWLDGVTILRTVTTSYDAAGRVTSVADPDATVTYSYDDAGRTTGTTSTPASGPALRLAYGHDAVGNRTSLADNLSAVATTTYEYDVKDRLATMTRQISGVTLSSRVVFDYDAADRRTALRRVAVSAFEADIASTTYGYADNGALTSYVHTVEGGFSYTGTDGSFTPDGTGRVTSASDPAGTLTYTYDHTGQLTGVGGYRTESYSYDLAGNRTMTGYSTSAGNRLDAAPGATYTYDSEGNRTATTDTATSAVTTYSYDHRNRLTGVTRRNSSNVVTLTESFVYDALGRRVKTVVDSDGAGAGSAVTTWTAYDGDNPYGDFDGSNALKVRYLHGLAIDELLARTDALGATAWYLTDRIGSVQDVIDSSGNLISSNSYNSFGYTVSTTGSGGDRFKFTGRESSSDQSLQYNRSRYYDPKVGRYLQLDPLKFNSSDHNLYRYVNNSPLNATDPTGLISDWANIPQFPSIRDYIDIPNTDYIDLSIGSPASAGGVQIGVDYDTGTVSAHLYYGWQLFGSLGYSQGFAQSATAADEMMMAGNVGPVQVGTNMRPYRGNYRPYPGSSFMELSPWSLGPSFNFGIWKVVKQYTLFKFK